MVSAASQSNINGHQFRLHIQRLVDDSGLAYCVECRRYQDATGYGPYHDIVIELPSGDVVIECKWHGVARGSIAQKLAYTMLWYSELAVPVIIVLGPDDNWPNRIVDRCKAHCPDGVQIMSETQLTIWLHGRRAHA